LKAARRPGTLHRRRNRRGSAAAREARVDRTRMGRSGARNLLQAARRESGDAPGQHARASGDRGEPGASDHRVWTETGCTCLLITSTKDVLR